VTAATDRARRLLAIYPTKAVAAMAAVTWAGYGARDVAVEHDVKGTTPDKPWAVTAAKAKASTGGRS
jgi:hypothetical protein